MLSQRDNLDAMYEAITMPGKRKFSAFKHLQHFRIGRVFSSVNIVVSALFPRKTRQKYTP